MEELVRAITSDQSFDPPVNIKYVLATNNEVKFTPVWWNEVEAEGFKLIEWLEIYPFNEEQVGALVSAIKHDYSAFIQNALEKNGIPYVLENGVFKVYGYTRPH